VGQPFTGGALTDPLAGVAASLKHACVGSNDEYTPEDRVLTIGVLARLAGWFLTPEAGGDEAMMDRYRRDLGRLVGHVPTNEECHRRLEDQIVRLRHSIGERW
jgi:hypothetical protein